MRDFRRMHAKRFLERRESIRRNDLMELALNCYAEPELSRLTIQLLPSDAKESQHSHM